MADRLIRISTALTVVTVALVAAIISYEHAYELVRSHGESGPTARLVPLTVDGLIYSSSMVLLQCARHRVAVPAFARWMLGLGITATLAANIAHGLGDGPVGAVVAAWPAVALVGSYELLMTIIRGAPRVSAPVPATEHVSAHVLDADPLQVQAAQAFADDLTANRLPSIRAIRTRLHVGQPRAQQVRAYLSDLTHETGQMQAAVPGAEHGHTLRGRRAAPQGAAACPEGPLVPGPGDGPRSEAAHAVAAASTRKN